jgi:hypothetical protein
MTAEARWRGVRGRLSDLDVGTGVLCQSDVRRLIVLGAIGLFLHFLFKHAVRRLVPR